MSAAEFLGSGLVIFFGAAAGRIYGERIMDSFRAVASAADMLERALLMLEYEQPTVEEMLSRLAVTSGYLPEFLRSAAYGRQAVLESLGENRDVMPEPDRQRLETLVRELGSADKQAEQQRISAALCYFRERVKILRPRAETGRKLSRSLGLLGGIFAVVLLV